MERETSFLASAEIAERVGVRATRYKTPDGKYIISEKDLRMLRFSMTAEEYVNGLDVEILTEERKRQLMAESTLGAEAVKDEVTLKEDSDE